jgi:hypothetical protein
MTPEATSVSVSYTCVRPPGIFGTEFRSSACRSISACFFLLALNLAAGHRRFFLIYCKFPFHNAARVLFLFKKKEGAPWLPWLPRPRLFLLFFFGFGTKSEVRHKTFTRKSIARQHLSVALQ